MPDVFLGLFKQLVIPETIVNGLAYPDYPPIVGGKFDSIYERDRGLTQSTLLAGVGFTSSDSAVRALFRSPGKYTSEMRQVIQALYSQGLSCPYDYKYNICHGVYTAADDSKWVIEISSSGVLAAPMPVITPTLTEHAWLGYTPDYDADLFDPGNPDLITLAASTELTDFYAKSPLFNSCGWAFNLDGSEAQNTCTDADSGYRYKIVIGDDGTAPSSASMSLIESGMLKFNNINGIKVPSSAEDSLYSIESFIHTTEGNYDAPLYVYYDGLTEKIVRSKHITESPPQVLNESLSLSGVTINGIRLPKLRNQIGTYRTGTILTKTDGTYITGVTVQESVYSASLKTITYTIVDQDENYIHNNLYDAAPNVVESRGDEKVQSGDVEKYVYACIVPLWERECVYQYKWSSQAASSDKYGWALCNDSQSTSSSATGTTGCYQVTSITGVNTSFSYLYRDNTKIHDKLSVGSVFCRSDPYFTPVQGQGSSVEPLTNSATLSLNGSGGVEETIWIDSTVSTEETAYNNVPSPESPQYMYVHKDSSKNNSLFCSEIMNGNSGADYYSLNVDQADYPTDSLPTSFEFFFVGEP